MATLIKTKINKGWTAFYNPTTKFVYGIHEFKIGGEANSALSLLSKDTKEELLAEITSLGLNYTPPVDTPQ
jgi:hypothetical protein